MTSRTRFDRERAIFPRASFDKVMCRNVWPWTYPTSDKKMQFHGFVLRRRASKRTSLTLMSPTKPWKQRRECRMAKPQASRLRFALVWIPAPAEEGREAQSLTSSKASAIKAGGSLLAEPQLRAIVSARKI
jgi:hypothetical protein